MSEEPSKQALLPLSPSRPSLIHSVHATGFSLIDALITYLLADLCADPSWSTAYTAETTKLALSLMLAAKRIFYVAFAVAVVDEGEIPRHSPD